MCVSKYVNAWSRKFFIALLGLILFEDLKELLIWEQTAYIKFANKALKFNVSRETWNMVVAFLNHFYIGN